MGSVQLFGVRNRILLRASALLTALATMAAIGAPAAQAELTPCGLHTLRGSYIFRASGFNIVAGVAQPKAIVEAIAFNGDGTLDVPAATVSINGGVVQPGPGVGVYTLDQACRGTVTFTPGPSFNIFTDYNGKQAWMIQTNQGTVMEGTVTRVSRLIAGQ